MINFCLLLWVLRKRLEQLDGKKIIESIGKSVICSAIMGLVLGALLKLFPLPPAASMARLVAGVGGGVAAGIAIYCLAAYALRCPELTDIRRLIKKEPFS